MPTVRTANHLLLESTTKSVESGTYDVICHFYTIKGMVVESEVSSCALSKLSLSMHSNETVGGYVLRKPIIRQKRTISNNLKVPEAVQGGHLNVFWNPFCCKISKKN